VLERQGQERRHQQRVQPEPEPEPEPGRWGACGGRVYGDGA
jgi:hypothetical protein